MTENLMNKDHKATNEKSRAGYDNINWHRQDEKVKGTWGDGKKQDANEFFKKFIKI